MTVSQQEIGSEAVVTQCRALVIVEKNKIQTGVIRCVVGIGVLREINAARRIHHLAKLDSVTVDRLVRINRVGKTFCGIFSVSYSAHGIVTGYDAFAVAQTF